MFIHMQTKKKTVKFWPISTELFIGAENISDKLNFTVLQTKDLAVKKREKNDKANVHVWLRAGNFILKQCAYNWTLGDVKTQWVK